MTERIVVFALLLGSGVYLAQALRLPLGTTARPGPGFYPLAVGAFACVVALVVVALAFRPSGRAVPAEAAEAEPAARLDVALSVIALAGFCLLLPWLGYPLAALLFVSLQLRQLGASWRGALLTGALSAEGSYYLFAILLGVTLPRGFWPH